MIKLLIIDDEEDIRQILSYNLRKEGFEVFEAQTGEEATCETVSSTVRVKQKVAGERDGGDTKGRPTRGNGDRVWRVRDNDYSLSGWVDLFEIGDSKSNFFSVLFYDIELELLV